MEGTGSCAAMKIIIGRVIKTWYTNLNIKLGAIRRYMCLKPLYIDLNDMGGTGSCAAMKIIFGYGVI